MPRSCLEADTGLLAASCHVLGYTVDVQLNGMLQGIATAWLMCTGVGKSGTNYKSILSMLLDS